MIRSRAQVIRVFLASAVWFCAPLVAFASVSITEVMYDLEGADDGREWVEVYNDGADEILLSDWFFVEREVKHRIRAFQGGELLRGGVYAIIADDAERFLLDNPTFSGILFDSSFSLSNSGEELILLDSERNVSDTISYRKSDGAAGDGHSLQLIADTWKAGVSTPGLENKVAAPSVPEVFKESVVTARDAGAPEASTGPLAPSLGNDAETKEHTKEAVATRTATVLASLPSGEEGMPFSLFWLFLVPLIVFAVGLTLFVRARASEGGTDADIAHLADTITIIEENEA